MSIMRTSLHRSGSGSLPSPTRCSRWWWQLFCHAFHRAKQLAAGVDHRPARSDASVPMQERHGRTPLSTVSLFDWIAVVRVSSQDYVDGRATNQRLPRSRRASSTASAALRNSAQSPLLAPLQCRHSQIKAAKTGGIPPFSSFRRQRRAAHRNTLLRCQARRTFQNITKPSGMPVISFWNAVEFRAIPSG